MIIEKILSPSFRFSLPRDAFTVMRFSERSENRIFIYMTQVLAQETPDQTERWYSGSNIFASGLFCLVAAQFFGTKFLAVGQILAFLAVGVTLVQYRGRAFRGGQLSASAWCLVAFVGISILSVFGNLSLITDPLDTLMKLRVFLLFLLILLMPALITDKISVPWRRDALVLAWLLPLGLALLLSMISLVTGWTIHHGPHTSVTRISGFYGQVMTFANCLQFTVLVLAALVLHPDWWRSLTRIPYWVAVVAMLIATVGLFLTLTRGAMLGAILGALVLGALKSRKAALTILVLIGISAIMAYSVGTRYFRANADQERINHWRAAALAAVERPVFGWGFRNFEQHSVGVKERYDFPKDYTWKNKKRQPPSHIKGHAHNIYLEAFASTGIFGGIAFLAFCFCWFREAKRSRYMALTLPLVIAFLVSGLFENTFFDAETLNVILLIWLFSQWLFAQERDHLAGLAESPESATGLIETVT